MKIHLYYRGPAWAAEASQMLRNPLGRFQFLVHHCNARNACYCYWYNTAVLVTQSQMELHSVMYQGLANLDVKPFMIKKRYDLV